MEIKWKLRCQVLAKRCTDLGIPIAGEMEKSQQLKNFLKLGKLSFYVLVARKF